MLDLSCTSWKDLRTAYGSASDVPDLLRQLHTAPPPQQKCQSEPWFSLWSALCHQGDVYTATYAAIPPIIAIAKTRYAVLLDCLNFVGYAEACRHHKRAPGLPPELKADYDAALLDAAELFIDALKRKWNEEETKVLLGGLASVRGHPRLGEAIIDLDSSFQCLECGCDLSGGLF
jgi:hypothetical protein